MISLTYLSTATTDFDEPALRELLQISRRNNHAQGLSGMLLFAGGHFIQTLEGAVEDVDAAFARIAADPRHRDVIVALREEVDERAFAGWSMGFEELGDHEVTRVPGFSDFLTSASERQRLAEHLGRAGVFHRVFRDRMR